MAQHTKKSSRRLKFLVIGPGLIGKKHIQLINENDRCTVEAVVSLHPEKYGEHFYHTLDQAFAAHVFDAAIISSPNECHYKHAMKCLEYNVPLLIEKPLTDTLESAQRLLAFAEKKSVPILVGHHRTYSAFIPEAKKIIHSERFGQLVSVQGSAQFYKPTHYFSERGWRQKKGGGPILINLIHDIGILRELCGEIVRVCAFSSNAVRGFEVEDTVSISCVFETGCMGTFILSDCAASTKSWEMTSGENPDYPHYPDEACYHFAGTKGSLDFPSMKFTYYQSTEDASWWKPFCHQRLEVTANDPLKCQLDHFISVVDGESKPLVSGRSAYNNMRVLDAIQQSISSERVVHL
ncbi:MAG: Gfo/Idh/MocA family oxidoreductase [Myxococcota bacterium]|nr:Gfo/Idh/MocA family oxidoreductase [Myxococcota bacterium]